MTGWNLPPGCTQADIDRAMGWDEPCWHDPKGVEIDLDGYAECVCGQGWQMTTAEFMWHRLDNPLFDKAVRRKERRDRWRAFKRRWSLLLFRWPLFRLLERIWPRQSTKVLHDEEIPF